MSCDPCANPVITNIPGPVGQDGAPGEDGIDGTNAFTFLTASFVMPNELENVTLAVIESTWASVGQNVYIQFAGEFEVVSRPGSTVLIVKNLEYTPQSVYLTNTPPGTVIPIGAQISPSGKQGAAGTNSSTAAVGTDTYITQTPRAGFVTGQPLSALASGLLWSQTGTGVVRHAVPGTDYLDPSTGLIPAVIGTTVQPKNANLDALAALVGAADRLEYFTGPGAMALATLTAFARTLLDDANANSARLTLGVRYGLLGSRTGLDLNTAGAPVDLATIPINSTRYIVDRVIATDASISLTVATLGLFGSAGGGVPVICPDQSLSALTSSIKQRALTIAGAGSTDIITDLLLIPRLGTPQGAAATVTLWVFGYDLS